MVLLFHIAAALGSLAAAVIVYFRPSQTRLNITYALSAAMLSSGTYLVIKNASHLIEACVLGLSLMTVIVYSAVSARSKLAHQTSQDD